MKRSTVSSVLGTGLVVAGLTLAGVAVPAFAHISAAEATCSELKINVTSYSTQADNAEPNTITITIDGKSDGPIPFGTGYVKTIPLDEKAGHTWDVYVDGVGEKYDRTYEGKTAACVEAPPETETPTPTDAPTPTPIPTPDVPAIPAVPVTPNTPTPNTPPPTTPTPAVTPTADSQKLAETGTDGTPVLAVGFLTVMAGAGALLLARRLRRTQH